MKRCCTCNKTLPVSEFCKLKSSKDGLHVRCRGCNSEANKAAHAKRIERLRNRRDLDMSEILTCRDCHLEKPRGEFHKNTTMARGASVYCKPCAIARTVRHWHKSMANPEWRRRELRRVAIRDASRRARMRGSFTWEEWESLLEKSGRICLKCGRADVALTVDHVIPVSMGGSSYITNLQPLCKPCNTSKLNRVLDYRPWTMDMAELGV